MRKAREEKYDAHVFTWWMHHHFKSCGLSAPVEEVRKATDDPLVHAMIDWLTLGFNDDNSRKD